MTAQTTSIDNEAVERRLIAWVERTLSVQVKSVERQNRWRPAWFLEIARSPAVEQLYVRGERITNGHGRCLPVSGQVRHPRRDSRTVREAGSALRIIRECSERSSLLRSQGALARARPDWLCRTASSRANRPSNTILVQRLTPET